MTKAYNNYIQNIDSTNTIEKIYEYFSTHSTPLQINELLRAEYVMLVSAFDCYIHDYVKEHMLEIFKEDNGRPKKFNEYKISLKTVCDILNENNPIEREHILSKEIYECNSKKSFQSPPNIEYALGLIGFTKIWSKLNENPEYEKKTLNLIIRRRNQIAHEADMNYSSDKKNEIEIKDLKDTKSFLNKLVKRIEDINV